MGGGVFKLRARRHVSHFQRTRNATGRDPDHRHAHGGEPTRIVVDGIDETALIGTSVAEARDHFADAHDQLREFLMREPRGHDDMFGAVPVETDDADLGVFFMDTDGYLDMCGHALIGVVTALSESGRIERQSSLTVETPAGLVDAALEWDGDRVTSVTFENVSSYQCDTVRVDFGGYTVRADVVYAGNRFALVDAAAIGGSFDETPISAFVDAGLDLRASVNEASPRNPMTGEAMTVDGVEFYEDGGHRSVVVFADGSVDRSPCGTGTCAKMTYLHHLGALDVDEAYLSEGPIGTTFEGRLLDATERDGVWVTRPEITGSAHVTGEHTFYRRPTDDLAGFTVR
ncbi:proline racemase family protein [Haloarculaceae archaeon H-GB11]|nr:proline racemase family protein [Haloarculaceae archaeon H-GB11]